MQFVHDNNRRSFLWRGVCSLLIVCQFNFIFYQFLKYIFDFFKSLTMKCVLQLPTRFWPLACRQQLSLSCLPPVLAARLSLSPAQLTCVHGWCRICWCHVLSSATKSRRDGSTSHIEERNVKVTIDWCDRFSRTAGNTWNNSTIFEQKLPHLQWPLTHQVVCVLVLTFLSKSLCPKVLCPPGSSVHGIFQARVLEFQL